MKKTVLRRYARLIARVGAGVQKGQAVTVFAQLDQPEFVTMLAEECYRAGASDVRVEFSHQPLEKLRYRHAGLKTLSRTEEWEKAKMQHQADTLPCRILLLSEDPDGLKGVNNEKYAKASQARGAVAKYYRDLRDGKEQWCIAAVPGKAWAKKVFPGKSASQAVEALWQAILTASRVTEDPEQAWKEHNENLHARCAYLNSLHLRSLHYTAGNGTDFTVGMMPEAVFCAGQEKTCDGKAYNPNIPSEECFISPKRGVAEGIVYSSKPLSWQGQIIDEFWIRFQDGKAVESGAKQGAELLEKMLTMDEGASYLGECALVPWESPINRTGILFYNTLFDENACCHLAVGRGFTDTIRDCHQRSQQEMAALGVNESIIHVDFMIGTEDLSIDGVTEDGETVPLFRNGTWAF